MNPHAPHYRAVTEHLRAAVAEHRTCLDAEPDTDAYRQQLAYEHEMRMAAVEAQLQIAAGLEELASTTLAQAHATRAAGDELTRIHGELRLIRRARGA